MEKAKLALEQERINSQQFQQQRDYEFKCLLQEKQHEDELEKLEAQKVLTQPRETIKAKSPRIPAFNEGKEEMDSYLLRFERYVKRSSLLMHNARVIFAQCCDSDIWF